MKKILLALVVLCGIAWSSSAQTSTTTTSSPSPADQGHFSIGIEGGIPTGNSHHVSNLVLGGSIKYEMPIASSTFFTISAGYNTFRANDFLKSLGGSSFNAIPVKVGVKYYVTKGFFAEGQVGAAFFTGKSHGTAFAYSPGIGYTFGNGFEAGVRYEGWHKNGTTGQAGLRLAYRF